MSLLINHTCDAFSHYLNSCSRNRLNMISEKQYFTLENMKIDHKMESNRIVYEVYPKNYYRRDEVAKHNKLNDFWVIVNKRVLDLSEFLERCYFENCHPTCPSVRILQNLACLPGMNRFFSLSQGGTSKMLGELLLYSGKDMSKFFVTIGDSKYKSGLDLSVFWAASTSEYGIANNLFWWNDPMYEIGRITSQEREVNVIDTHKSEFSVAFFFMNCSALFIKQ